VRLHLRKTDTGDRLASQERASAPCLQTFASLLREKESLIGAAVTIGSTLCAQITARVGFDWVLIDMEHAPVSAREASMMVQAVVSASGGRCVPIIRTPSHGVEWIKWALDSGAAGIIIPMVTSAKECEDIVQRAIYPPRGQRSFGPFLAPYADVDPTSDVTKYLRERVKDVAIIPMIESAEGVQNAEEILSVPGVTGCFVGPYDLRQSMGLSGGDGEEPAYVRALEKVLQAGKKNDVVIGTVGATEASAKRKIEMGFKFLLTGQEPSFLAAGASAVLLSCQRGANSVRSSNL
jgi:2-keto-3-deoxy-L-rhamnonate aldolase RhmA